MILGIYLSIAAVAFLSFLAGYRRTGERGDAMTLVVFAMAYAAFWPAVLAAILLEWLADRR